MLSVVAFLCGGALALPLVMDGAGAHASAPMTARMAASASSLVTVASIERTAPTDDAAGESSASIAAAPIAIARAVTRDTSSVVMFNGRPIRPARTITMKVTAYSPDARSCGDSADGITASGYSVWTNGGRMVAADTELLPLGSLVSIPGYDDGSVVPVLDRGGAIKGKRLDVLYATHEQARAWGVQDVQVTVWEYADGKPNDFRENHWKKS